VIDTQNGNSTNPKCDGIQGVVDAYGKATGVLQRSSPTSLAPVIDYAAK
jgi:Copine